MDQAELAPLMAQSTVFLMPSLYESCGNGWLEAMACAIPVVGSTLSCGPEVVADQETGFVVDPNNPQEIADKVSLLLQDEELNRRMGAAGRRRALEMFSVDVGVRKSEAFYEQCRSRRS
jgi:glycosyltransferase involved in cell wall biosynthesis